MYRTLPASVAHVYIGGDVMILDEKPIHELNEADLLRLVDEKVKELRVVEYKRQLPGGKEPHHREFLADVSSFANARGGYLLFGIEEAGGEPTGICGVESPDWNAEVLRLESIVRSGIAPRLQVRTQPVELQSGRFVFVMKIPRSWAGPHIVMDSGRFYSRTSAGKYILDVYELRSAFIASESTADRIRAFRISRLSSIVSGDTPHEIREGPKLVLHILPLVSFGLEKPQVGLGQIGRRKSRREGGFHLSPLYRTGFDAEGYNFDGYLTYNGDTSYLQLFRDGRLETLSSLWGGGRREIRFYADHDVLVLRDLKSYLGFLEDFGIAPPYMIMLSLVEAAGILMTYTDEDHVSSAQVNSQDTRLFPDVFVENPSENLAETMKPAFDVFYSAAGLSGSPRYDALGKWIGPEY